MEGKDGEVLTEHEPPKYFWDKQTGDGGPMIYDGIDIYHLQQRIENIEKRLIPQNVLSVFLIILGILIYIK